MAFIKKRIYLKFVKEYQKPRMARVNFKFRLWALICICLFSSVLVSKAHADNQIPEPFAGSSFPNKDFALHGGPVIGTQIASENTVIDEAIGNRTGLHISAWATGGFNVSNAQTLGGNLPTGYTVDPNQFDLTEAIIRVVKFADTVQKNHVDWGLKVDGLYGKDYYRIY